MKDHKREKNGQDHDQEQAKTEEILEVNVEKIQEEEQQQNQPTEERQEDKIAALNDKYLRLAAEFDNYRRRTAKERLDLVLSAGEETIIGVLPVLDDCERALDVLRHSDGDNSVAIEGTELIYNKLFSYLESKGLKKIESVGKELNTDFHEAIAQLPAQKEEQKNKIIEVAQQGYTLNGKVIRFAKVVVGI